MLGASCYRVASWRLCVACALVLALLCGCAPFTDASAMPEDEMPPMPDLVLARGAGTLAVELVDAARMQNVFKLTYEELSDLYGVLLEPFDRLIVYVPGLDGSDALFLGVLPDRKYTADAQQELDLLFEQLCEANPDLFAPQIVTRGRYVLYICAADPDPAFALFERALVWRA